MWDEWESQYWKHFPVLEKTFIKTHDTEVFAWGIANVCDKHKKYEKIIKHKYHSM